MALQWLEVMETLRCALCGEQLRSPVFQCSKGHTGCERCYVGEEVCVCGGKLGSRNYAAETLLETLEGECQYCTSAVPYSEAETHSRTCANRLYLCPFCHGYSCFPPAQLQSHLMTHHNLRWGVSTSYFCWVEMQLSPQLPENGFFVRMPGQLRLVLKLFAVKGREVYVTGLMLGEQEVGVRVSAETEECKTKEVAKTLIAGEQTVLFRIHSYTGQPFRLTLRVFPTADS